MKINDYANSMFRYDFLNNQWICECTQYLKYIFGKKIENLVAIDYAFGRGNWSLALLNVGVRKVFAIDASQSNCDRFHEYLKEKKINKIEIIKGNALQQKIPLNADFVWAHGILPNVESPGSLIESLREMAPGPRAIIHLYSYDKTTLRETVITAARKGVTYANEKSFRKEAPLFSHVARMRVRDDLTAPFLNWMTIADINALAVERGLYVSRRNRDFSEWQKTKTNEEFQPHNLILTPINQKIKKQHKKIPNEPLRPSQCDVRLLSILAEPLFDPKYVSPVCAKQNAIGICNTHFAAMSTGSIQNALLQNLLYILYNLYSHGLCDAIQDHQAGHLLKLADAALRGQKRRSFAGNIGSRFLAPYLLRNNIRL